MTAPDPHEVLGVTCGTPPAALKACYRRLAKRYHPDVNGQDPTAEWLFKQVRAAFVTL